MNNKRKSLLKRWSVRPYDKHKVKALEKELKINPLLCQILNQRGVDNFEEARQYFRPELSNLHSPFLMTDMEKASIRLIQAIENRENIMVYGDYDVDGTTAVSLVSSFLKERKAMHLSLIHI